MFIPRDVKDRAVQYPARYKLVLVSGTTDTYDLVPVPGTISNSGTAINKAYLQPIEDWLGATRKITAGTADPNPALMEDGEVYLQYE